MCNFPILPHNLTPYLAYFVRRKHIQINQRADCFFRVLVLKLKGKDCGRDFAKELVKFFDNPPDKVKGKEIRVVTHDVMLQQLKKLEKKGKIEILETKEMGQRLFLAEFLLIGNWQESLKSKGAYKVVFKTTI